MANSTGNRPIYRQAVIDKYIERYAEAHMNDTIKIERGVHPVMQTLYEGRGRVHLLASPVQMGFGDESQYMVTGVISIPRKSEVDDVSTLPMVNDLITVIAHQDDRMVNRTFWITHIDSGGQFHNVLSMSVIGSEDSPTVTGRLPEATP